MPRTPGVTAAAAASSASFSPDGRPASPRIPSSRSRSSWRSSLVSAPACSATWPPAPSAVPPAVVSAAEDTLAAAESVGDHLAELLAAAAEDPDAVAELPPLLRARAFLAVAQASTSLFAGRGSRLPVSLGNLHGICLSSDVGVGEVDQDAGGAQAGGGEEEARRGEGAQVEPAVAELVLRAEGHRTWRKKRKYELGRQPANTKLSSNKTVRMVRVRGGNVKWRALRLDTGNYSWGSEAVTRKTRILDVVYNASNNELVRTQTLVKSAIVQVDAAPFKQWYLTHYGVSVDPRDLRLSCVSGAVRGFKFKTILATSASVFLPILTFLRVIVLL